MVLKFSFKSSQLEIENFQTTSDGEMTKSKVVDHIEMYKSVVCNFFIWCHLSKKNCVWISHIWNSKFLNNFGWTNDQSCSTHRYLLLCSGIFSICICLGSQIHILKFGKVNTRIIFVPFSHKWHWGLVVRRGMPKALRLRFEPP